MTKSILLAGGGMRREECIERCRAIGIAAHPCDAAPQSPVPEAAEELVRRVHADGIYAADPASAGWALALARKLRLPVPPCVAEPGSWSALWERILGVPGLSAEGRVAVDHAAAAQAAACLGFPCWVRPIAAWNGAHCTYVEHEADLELRVTQAIRLSSEECALIQRPVPGAVWRVLGFKVGHGFVPVEALEEGHREGDFRVARRLVLRGGVSAADYVPVTKSAEKLAAMLTNGFGLVEFEFVVTEKGPVAVDVRLRPSVEQGVDALLRAGLGMRLLDDALRVAVKDAPHAAACQGLSGCLLWLSSASGVVEAVEGAEEARAMPGVAEVAIAAAPGHALGHAVDEAARDRLGYVVAVAGNPAKAQERAEAACAAIRIRTRRVAQ